MTTPADTRRKIAELMAEEPAPRQEDFFAPVLTERALVRQTSLAQELANLLRRK